MVAYLLSYNITTAFQFGLNCWGKFNANFSHVSDPEDACNQLPGTYKKCGLSESLEQFWYLRQKIK